jgi:hypothetical protein
VKLRLLLGPGCSHVPFGTVWRAYYVGSFFNNILPGSVGGDFVKISEVRKAGISLRRAAAAVVVERATGLAVVLGLAVLVGAAWPAMVYAPGLRSLRWVVLGVGLGGLMCGAAAYALWRRGLRPWLSTRPEDSLAGRAHSLLEAFSAIHDEPARLALALLLSLVFYGGIALTTGLALAAVGPAVSAPRVVSLVPITRLAELVPITVGGLGVREGALTYCTAHFGPTAAQATAAGLLLRLTSYACSAIGGVLYALGRRTEPTTEDGTEAQHD